MSYIAYSLTACMSYIIVYISYNLCHTDFVIYSLQSYSLHVLYNSLYIIQSMSYRLCHIAYVINHNYIEPVCHAKSYMSCIMHLAYMSFNLYLAYIACHTNCQIVYNIQSICHIACMFKACHMSCSLYHVAYIIYPMLYNLCHILCSLCHIACLMGYVIESLYATRSYLYVSHSQCKIIHIL